MEIIHDLSRKQFQTVADGKTAYVSYDLVDGCLNIEHTIVPREIEGRGIAAALAVFSAKTDSISKSLSFIYFKASYIGMCDSVS